MSKSLSVFLDLLRFGASLVIVYGHLTQGYFSTGWRDLHSSLAAVAVFFVMSGFVIYETAPRHPNFANYLLARLSRMYSVVVPAAFLTIILLAVGCALNAGFYRQLAGECDYPVLRTLASLTFTNQVWGVGLDIPSDSPFWSLGFEVPYYLLFGLAYYLTGSNRILLLALATLIVGPTVLLLLPVWLLGAGLAHILNTKPPSERLAPFLFLAALILVIASGPISRAFERPMEHSEVLKYLFLGRSRFFSFLPVGLGTCFAVAGMKSIESRLLGVAAACEGPIRIAAGSTFSLYLYHFPLLFFIAAVTRYDRASSPAKVALFLAVCGLCFALSRFTESKNFWKGLLLKTVPAFRDRLANAVQ